MWPYTCAEREILYNTYQEMAIWKSIVTLICRELLALNTINLIFYLQRHIPTYLSIYIFYENYRFYSIFASHFPILMSFRFPQSNLFYITAWQFVHTGDIITVNACF
jgi:hypothetical protein